MNTDTKAVVRWDLDYTDLYRTRISPLHNGDYVLFTDHEQVVAELRAELAAKSKDAARWDWIMRNYYGGDLPRTQKVIGSCFSREAMESAIDKDMGGQA